MRRPIVALTLLGVVLLAGCSSSGNGISGASATDVAAKVKQAVSSAGSYHVSGTAGDTSQAIELDVTTKGAARGTVTGSTGRADLVVTGPGQNYLRASAEFWTSVLGSSARAASYADKWLRLPAGAPGTPGTDLDTLIDLSGTLSVAKATQVDGKKAVALTATSEGVSRTYFIPTTGEPVPFKSVTESGGQLATLTFSDWGQSVEVAAPSPVITLGSS